MTKYHTFLTYFKLDIFFIQDIESVIMYYGVFFLRNRLKRQDIVKLFTVNRLHQRPITLTTNLLTLTTLPKSTVLYGII